MVGKPPIPPRNWIEKGLCPLALSGNSPKVFVAHSDVVLVLVFSPAGLTAFAKQRCSKYTCSIIVL